MAVTSQPHLQGEDERKTSLSEGIQTSRLRPLRIPGNDQASFSRHPIALGGRAPLGCAGQYHGVKCAGIRRRGS